jgi:AcrR family transcriptional regulator
VNRSLAERTEVIAAIAEVFREHGYEGTSLSAITARTGLGKGSLYHLFPGGKEEMAAAILDAIHDWFSPTVFVPLRENPDAAAAIRCMLRDTNTYFRSGRRVCLVGAFALGDARDRFADRVGGYFAIWRDALADALRRAGRDSAEDKAEHAVLAIQGALVLARALDDPAVFGRALERVERDLLTR